MKYLSIMQTAERWGISTHCMQILYGEGHVLGAIRIGSVWGIPEDAAKPADARIKNGKYIKQGVDGDELEEISNLNGSRRWYRNVDEAG